MVSSHPVLEFLATTRAANTRQLADWVGVTPAQLRGVIRTLENSQMIRSVARVRFGKTGRPQTVWQLTGLGANEAGVYFSNQRMSRDSLTQALLRAWFRLQHREAFAPVFFADQVAAFERFGARWPWQGRIPPSLQGRDGFSGDTGPQRVGALVLVHTDTVHVALPVLNETETLRLLAEPERRFAWTHDTAYRLSIVFPERLQSLLNEVTQGVPDMSDPYFKQTKTYREWRAQLRRLSPAEQKYRRYIEVLLRRIERRGQQNSGECHLLRPLSFSASSLQAELVNVGALQVMR